MKTLPDFLLKAHDPDDPDPWLALYLDQSTPLPDAIKQAWLADSSCKSRQYLLPFVRPLARGLVVMIQMAKAVLPRHWSSSPILHRLLASNLQRFVSPEANWLILRHFHLGSQILAFIAANAPTDEPVPTRPLTPLRIDDLRDDLFLKHDLNLFNFVINLNRALRDSGRALAPVPRPDFSMIREPPLALEAMPRRWTNVIDLQTAIELFTPVYQFFLTDNDFWRAANSLQLDEVVGLNVATILGKPEYLVLLNNKHPMVPLATLAAGHRLVLHGLSTEMLHGLLSMQASQQAQSDVAGPDTVPGSAAVSGPASAQGIEAT